MNNKVSIGLALSGGGHKGLAHAGVLQFLEEKNIQINVISGTSAGAIVGGLYAIGKKPTEILDFFKSVKLFSWNHLSFSKAGLLDAEKFIEYLDDVFGETKLVDFPKEMYISATDINSGRLKTFNRYTKAKEAIAASSAFPGVFSPVQIEGRLYCDGGILANFPAHIIQGRCDFLIGVNLDTQETTAKESKEFGSIKSVVLRAIEIMMKQNVATQDNLCDWCILPLKSTDYSTFETSKDRMDEIFHLGYEAAKKGFETVREKLMKAYQFPTMQALYRLS